MPQRSQQHRHVAACGSSSSSSTTTSCDTCKWNQVAPIIGFVATRILTCHNFLCAQHKHNLRLIPAAAEGDADADPDRDRRQQQGRGTTVACRRSLWHFVAAVEAHLQLLLPPLMRFRRCPIEFPDHNCCRSCLCLCHWLCCCYRFSWQSIKSIAGNRNEPRHTWRMSNPAPFAVNTIIEQCESDALCCMPHVACRMPHK